MNDDDVCQCGHERGEHEHTGSSTPSCEVRGCDCFAFEAADTGDDE